MTYRMGLQRQLPHRQRILTYASDRDGARRSSRSTTVKNRPSTGDVASVEAARKLGAIQSVECLTSIFLPGDVLA